MEVILVRHTRVKVPPGTCYGWSDVPVADTFEEEAAEVYKRIAGYQFDQAFTSPLSRARQLADYCGFPDAVADDRLREMNMGDWEMQRYEEINDPALKAWYEDYLRLPTTNGESFPLLYARVAQFLDELRIKHYRRVVIFAHAGVLVCAGIYAGLFAVEDAFAHQVEYGGTETIFL